MTSTAPTTAGNPAPTGTPVPPAQAPHRPDRARQVADGVWVAFCVAFLVADGVHRNSLRTPLHGLAAVATGALATLTMVTTVSAHRAGRPAPTVAALAGLLAVACSQLM